MIVVGNTGASRSIGNTSTQKKIKCPTFFWVKNWRCDNFFLGAIFIWVQVRQCLSCDLSPNLKNWKIILCPDNVGYSAIISTWDNFGRKSAVGQFFLRTIFFLGWETKLFELWSVAESENLENHTLPWWRWVFGDFYAIFEFLSRCIFLLNYNYLSRCAGEPIFIFWKAIHMCYNLHNPKSWFHCHDTWAGFLLNMHKNQLFIFKIFKIRSAEISVIIAYDLKGAPRIFSFQFVIWYNSSIGSQKEIWIRHILYVMYFFNFKP